MPLEVRRSVEQMLAEAMSAIETLDVDQARTLHGRPDVTFIDLRDPREIWREGGVPGARQVPRGMLESGSIQAVPTTRASSPRPQVRVLLRAGWRSRSRRRRRRTWGSLPCATSRAGSTRGRNPAPRWKRSSRSRSAARRRPDAIAARAPRARGTCARGSHRRIGLNPPGSRSCP